MSSNLHGRRVHLQRLTKMAVIVRWSFAPLAAGWALSGGACTEAHSEDELGHDAPLTVESESWTETAPPTPVRDAAVGGTLATPGMAGELHPIPPEVACVAGPPGGSCAEAAAEVGAFWIAFDSDRRAYNRDLYAIRADGSGLTRLTEAPSSEREPAFSFDGKRLAYVSDVSGSAQIYLYDFATGARTQLTHRAEGADQPSWSPDGLQLAFHSGLSVYLIDADGGRERELARGLDSFNAYKNPAFSRDGLQVVFDRNNEINAIGVDGTGMRQVIRNWTATIAAPSVSWDGYNIAYSVYCNGEQVVIAPLASNAVLPCEGAAASSGNARQPAWGPSEFIAYELSQGGGTGPSRIALSVGPESAPCMLESMGTSRDLNPSWAPETFELPSGFEPF
jgi:Tol biopolymer transport system component